MNKLGLKLSDTVVLPVISSQSLSFFLLSLHIYEVDLIKAPGELQSFR